MANHVITRTAWTDDDGSGTTGTVITNAEKTTIYNQVDDFVRSAVAGVCEGRITLTASTPVTVSDVTAATTVRFAPYKGYRIGLYDGSKWLLYTFTELSLSLGSDAANTNYDLFAYDSGGTVTLERLAWTNDTTRATALTTQNGILVKSGATTRRYLGTYRTTGSAGQTEDSFAKRFVWNYYNRVDRPMRATDATNSWNYTTATIRQANASTANQVAFVIGWAESLVAGEVIAHFRSDQAAVSVAPSVGIGEDTTTAFTTGFIGGQVHNQAANGILQIKTALKRYPAVGYHYWAWLEISTAVGTTTWLGDSGVTALQSGLHASLAG
jgi:hypothetical protein